MRRHNITFWTLLILTVNSFALASPVLVQKKRQASVDVVHAPEDGITVSGKRFWDPDLDLLFSSFMFRELRNLQIHPPADVQPPDLEQMHGLWEAHVPPPDLAQVHGPEGAHVPPPDLAQVHGPEGAHVLPPDVPPPDPADPDRESIELDSDAPPASPGSEHSHSSSTGSENWYTAPSSPVSDSESEVNRWSTISNAPSTESQSSSEKLKEADYIIKGKGKANAHSDSDLSNSDSE